MCMDRMWEWFVYESGIYMKMSENVRSRGISVNEGNLIERFGLRGNGNDSKCGEYTL